MGTPRLPIPSLQWNNVTDSAAGIWDIACVAGDDVEMELRHGLAGGGAVVGTKVESVRWGRKVCGQVLSGPINPYEQTGFLGAGKFLKAGDGSARDNQGVAGRDRKFVGHDGKEFVGGENAVRS